MPDLSLYPFTTIDATATGGTGDDRLGWGLYQLSGGSGPDDPFLGLNYVFFPDASASVGSPVPDLLAAVEITAGDGNDTLNGLFGNDWLRPGIGNDVVNGDFIFANGSHDIVLYDDAPAAVMIDLRIQAGVAQDTIGAGIDTLTNIDSVAGSAFGDTLIGNEWTNYLFGLDGDDLLQGDAGNDTLDGGAGSDTLEGGEGDDAIHGSAEPDDAPDTASYAGADGFVVVDLAIDGVAQDTVSAGLDTLFDIDDLTGSAHGDILSGDAGGNLIDGLSGNDTIDGREGDDSLRGGPGFDTLIGGTGSDTVLYDLAIGSVTVNLTTLTANTPDGALDTLASIENVEGSEFDDVITGDGAVNVLDGNGGDDEIRGGLGDDTLRGGSGTDTLSYEEVGGDVIVDLTAGTATGAAGTDTLSGFENVIGSNLRDVITGNALGNTLSGLAGNDILVGSDSVDTLDGGAGLDTASYATFTAAISANLISNSVTKGGITTDALVSIENITGTIFHNDTLIGDAGFNVLDGLGGDDLIDGLGGNDILNGGAGTDTASYFGATAAVTVNLSAGTATGGAGTDTLTGFENILGTFSWNDTLIGDTRANVIAGWGGADTIRGGAGNDVLDGGVGTDTVGYIAASGAVFVDLTLGIATGADGTDTLSNFENIVGGAFADTLTGNAGNNVLDGSVGTDTASYLASAAAIVANLTTRIATGQGTDTFFSIENVIGSATAADTLTGSSGANVLDGSGGNDTLFGLGGNDTLLGGAGTDTLEGGLGTDALNGGDGLNDRAIYANATAGVTVNLAIGTASGGDGADTLSGIEDLTGSTFADVFTGGIDANIIDAGAGADEVNAGAGNDTLLGGLGDDILRGDAGNDVIDGGGGAGDLASWFNDPAGIIADLLAGTATDGYGNTDTLLGIERLSGAEDFASTLSGSNDANIINAWLGADTLTGRGGADTLQGGAGDDRFVYLLATDAPAGETITDFSAAGGDLIDLAAIDTNAATAGDQGFAFIGTAAFSAAGSAQVRFSGTAVEADVNGDGLAEMVIAMTGVTALSAGDFVL